jgi:hypothetical protein
MRAWRSDLRWLVFAALALLVSARADAATLYISEFVNGVSTVGTTLPQVPPQPSIANQIVGLSGTSAASAAFNSRTRVVSLICDEGCSISIGAGPTATTSNYLLQQGVAVSFGVNPGDKVAAIANAAGNTGGGGGGGGTSSSFSAAFPATGTAAGFENSVSGNMVPGVVDNATGGVNVNIVGGGGAGGTSSSFAAAFPATGTAIGAKNGANMVNLTADNSNNLNVDVAVSALPTGAATSALQTTGNTALGTINTTLGSPFQAGASIANTAFIANAGTNLNTSALALESGGNLASLVTQLGAVTASPTANTVNDRLKTINTTLGSPFQVGGSIGNTTFAVTNTGTFAVQATLANETTKVIGTVNQGTSPWVTSGTSTVSGTVAATQGTSPWVVSNGGTFPTQATLAAETTKVIGTVNQGTSPWVSSVTGSVTANAGTNLNTSALALDTSVGTTNTDLGPPGATACATDTGSCSLNALTQRLAQRLTTINTTLGTPMQATGGTVGLVAGSAVIGHVINDASSAVIGHVIADTGSTTAVTQATGTNLHAVLDTTSTTAVTQATGTNLHAVLDTTSTTAVTQATGTNLHAVIDSGSTTAVTGNVAITAASGSIASGAVASGAIASGAVASGAFASGALASGSISNGADVAEGLTTDAKNAATDTTAVSQTSILKEISALEQAPVSRAVTNTGTFAVQATLAAETTKVIGTVNQGTSPWIATGSGTAGSAASGVSTIQGIASMTPVQVSQATAASLNATIVGTGTFATQSAITAASGSIASGAVASGAVASGAYASGSISDGAVVTLGAKADAKSAATDTTAITVMQVQKEISAQAQIVGAGYGATGAAPPANVVYNGANGSGAAGGVLQGLYVCDSYVFKHITSATDTLAVQGVTSKTVRICGIEAWFAGTATFFLENTASTNANCSSTLAQIDILRTGTAQTGEVDHAPFWNGKANSSGNGLCINSTGTGGVDVGIYYEQS